MTAWLFALAICAFGPQVTSSLQWEQLSSAAPWTPRSDMCAVVLGDRLVMTGGHKDNDYSAEVWSTTDGTSWTQVLAQAPWAARSYHSCAVLPDERLIIVGGHSKSQWFNDVWVSGAGGNVSEWEQLTASASFSPRAAGSLQYQAGSKLLYYLGGSDGLLPPVGKNATLFNDVYVSSDFGKEWTRVTGSAEWDPREGESGGSGVVIGADDTLTVIGGEHGYFPNAFFGDVWTSTDGKTWTERASKAEWVSGSWTQYKGRSGHIVDLQTTASGKQALWLSGGYLGRNDVWCLGGIESASDLAGKWTKEDKAAPWKGRYDHIMKVFKGKLLLFGGENSALGFGGPYFNDVWAASLPEDGC